VSLDADHHIHARYSNCCKEDYGLPELMAKLASEGMAYLCVTDHVHGSADSAGIAEHRAALAAMPPEARLLPAHIGAEVSLLTGEGAWSHRFIRDGLEPAFIVAGCHWIPDTPLTMGDIPGSRAYVQGLGDAGLEALFARQRAMQEGAVAVGGFDILAHPNDLFFRVGVFDSRLIDMSYELARKCAAAGIAVEVNGQSLRRCREAAARPEALRDGPFALEPLSFMARLIDAIADSGCLISAGSDAHRLAEAGRLQAIEAELEARGIGADRLFRLSE
jgi:histidinol phosphatase-like PHP family hydrolase